VPRNVGKVSNHSLTNHLPPTVTITDSCTTTTPTEDLPSTYPSKIRENGTLGVHFTKKHQNCRKSISFPAINHTSMIESSHSNTSQTNMDDNIFQRQEVMHSKPEKKDNEVSPIYINALYDFY
jgi:hypothetical protein